MSLRLLCVFYISRKGSKGGNPNTTGQPGKWAVCGPVRIKRRKVTFHPQESVGERKAIYFIKGSWFTYSVEIMGLKLSSKVIFKTIMTHKFDDI